MVISYDDGKTWKDEPLYRHYNGGLLISALGAAPDHSRFLYSTVVHADETGQSRCYLVVQGYSEPGERREDSSAIQRLITDLGSAEPEVVEVASRKLATLGVAARRELEVAAEREIPEIAERAKLLLDAYFPKCLVFETHQHGKQ